LIISNFGNLARDPGDIAWRIGAANLDDLLVLPLGVGVCI